MFERISQLFWRLVAILRGPSDLEEWLLAPFFTNSQGNVFLIHQLPENMTSVLMAMYSRMNNPRGIRGVFLDNFLPSVLATLLPECQQKFGGDPKKFLDHYQIKNITEFAAKWPHVVREFMRNFEVDPKYLKKIVASKKMRVFLKTWLDAYGHNSIARVGAVHICFENISILAAKSLEWGRPGSAYIELSTRYVKMSAAGLYPIWTEFSDQFGVDASWLQQKLQRYFELYQQLQGNAVQGKADEFDGPLPSFLWKRWADIVGDEKKLRSGVFGEMCDVLGNLLPAATLTSVGITVSGEALPNLIKHLRLDDTPENHALADAVITECEKTGAAQFIAHVELTEWDWANWIYLREPAETIFPERSSVERTIWSVAKNSRPKPTTFEDYIAKLPEEDRTQYGKLGRVFELVTVTFAGIMSFRGWRDLQRMGMATHVRGRMNPHNGFYKYDKPAPIELDDAFREAHEIALEIWEVLTDAGVPEQLREYVMPLGILVDYVIAANLRQCEFMNWQRSKASANHEVRQQFLLIEKAVRAGYPWWRYISRADMTEVYVFARGSAIPLPLAA